MWLRFAICVALVTVGLGVSSNAPPTWTYDTNFKCATSTVISATTGAYFTTNINYAATFTVANPQVSVGLVGLQPTTATSSVIYFLVNIGAQNLTGFTLQVSLNSASNFTTMKISYFAKNSNSSYSYMFVDYQSVTLTNLASGTGNRIDTSIVIFSSHATIDMTHTYVVLPFITGVNMSKVSSSNAQLELLTEVYNTTHYKCSYKSGGATLVYSVTYYSLTFDQTAAQQTNTQFFDTVFKTGTSGVEVAFTLKASSATNFHAGLNGFNFTNANGLTFNFAMTSLWNLTTTSAYLYVNISTWNYRNRACASPYIYYEAIANLCYSTCATGFYANVTYSFCAACGYTCATCSNGTGCLTCSASNFRTLSGTACPCDAGYFDNGVALCVACDYTCATCSSSNATSCLTCAASSLRTLNAGSCPCNSGYYNSGASVCSVCDYSCVTCSAGSSTSCLTCNSAQFRTISGGGCPCNAGYYDNGLAICSACHYSCATCTGGTSSSCVTCSTANLRTLSANSCPCNAKYYDNGVGLCSACLVSCATCNSGTSCLTCVSPNATTQASGGCICNSGYYNSSSTVCTACHYSCLTCTSSTNTTCVTCKSANYRTLSSGSCPCNSGYYDNGVGLCVACLASCATCSTGSACLTCVSPSATAQASGGCLCNSGFYSSSSTACAACHYSCATCTAATSITCLTCNSTSFRTLSTGSCPCNAKYFDNGVSVCVACHYSCSTCNGSNSSSCLTCSASNFRTFSASACPCNNGYYDSGTLTCSACLSTCATCTTGTTCATCISNNMTAQLSGGCTCNTGFYINTTNSQCVACDSTCSACTSTACTTCISIGMVVNGNVCKCSSTSSYYNSTSSSCVACGNNCATCTSSTVCTSCTNAGLSITGGTCACTSGRCYTCGTGCASCSSATVCTTCISGGMVVTGSTCSCFATDNYFDSSSNACVQCPIGCATCTDSSSCGSCKSSTLQLTGTLCTCVSAGQYYNTTAGSCVACPLGCSSCVNSSFCSTCSSRGMTINNNLCQCPAGQYFNTTACTSCPNTCAACNSASNCTTCALNQMTLLNGVCSCSAGKYFAIPAACQSCQSDCQTCSSSSSCDSCNTTQHLSLNSTNRCSCAGGYTLNVSTGLCDSQGACPAGYQFTNGACAQICGDGLLYVLDCDDGNLENGDGCDSTCHIEEDFVCRSGSQTTPSICSYNKSLSLQLKRTIKDPYENSIYFHINVKPPLKVINQFNPSTFTTNLPSSSIEAAYDSGELTLKIIYTASIQRNQATVQVTPPNDVDQAYAMRVSSTLFVVQPDNNQPAIFYQQDVYSHATLVNQVATYTVMAALAFTFIGVFIARTIVLEMITAMQIALFSLTLIDSLSPYLAPLATWVRMSNGYNTMFFYLKDLMSFNHPTVPSPIYAIEYEAEFMYNMNVILLAEGGMVVIIAFMFLISLFKSGHRTSIAEKIGGFFARELAMSLIIFSCCAVVFCTSINIQYGKDDSNFIANIAVAGAAFIPILYLFVYYVAATGQFKDAQVLFKKDRLSQVHPIILMVQRMVLAALITLPSLFSQIVYAIVGFQAVYIIYVIVKRPYLKGYMSVRAVLNQLLLLVALFVPLYYNQLSNLFSLGVVYDYLPWFFSGAAIGLVVITIFFFLFWTFQRCCSKDKRGSDNQIHPIESADRSQNQQSEQPQDQPSEDATHQRSMELIDMDSSQQHILEAKQQRIPLGIDLKRGGVRKYKGFAKNNRQEI